MEEFQLKFITNKQSVRILKLVSAFQHTHSLSVKELAKITKTSARTTLTDIQKVKEHFTDSINLQALNTGYSFNLVSKQQFEAKKAALLKEEPLFIIIENIFFSNYHTITEWSDLLFTTVSTLDRQLSNIQPILDNYELSLSKTPLDLNGKEINIRQFFHDFYYESDITHHSTFPSHDFQKVTLTLARENFLNEFIYISFTEFNYLIFIALQRSAHGKTFYTVNEEVMHLINLIKVDMKRVNISKTKALISDLFQIELIDLELAYLYTMLLTKRSILSIEAEKQFISRFNLWKEAKTLAIEYAKILNIPSKEKNNSLILFESFFINVYLKNTVSPILNQVLDDVSNYAKTRFPAEFKATKEFIKNNLSNLIYLSTKQVDGISAELVLNTNSIRTFYWNRSKHIAFLFEGNRYITENIRTNVYRYLGKHHSLYFPNVSELSTEYFTNNRIELLVTNYSEHLVDLEINIPILLFDRIPSNKDWNRLLDALELPDTFSL